MENNINSSEENFTSNSIDIREIIETYWKYWKWFLVSAIISLLFAYLYLNFQRKSYEATSTIKIKSDNTGDQSTLSAFQDLGVLPNSNQNTEDEMEILLSKDLIREAVKSLKFNIQFFHNKNKISNFFDDNLGLNTNFYENEIYSDFPLDISFFAPDSTIEKSSRSMLINITSLNKYSLREIKKNKEDVNYKVNYDTYKSHNFGEKIKSSIGDLIITPNVKSIERNKLIGQTILVNIAPLDDLTLSYSKRLQIEPKADYSSVLSLKIVDGNKGKAEDFLTELVNKYNEQAIKVKEELTKSTSDFVNRRLEIITEELANVDLTAESIKTRYRLSDVASETGLNMQSGRDLENQIVRTNTQIENISRIKDYVSTKGTTDLIPSDIGMNDNSLSSTIEQYNAVMLQKKRLLENSTEKNPVVSNINDQLKSLEENINSGLNNLESSRKLSLDALTNQSQKISSRLYSAPKQERQIRDIKRQQQIKEQLFLYLLQKREETAITLGVADPNAKIIDSSSSGKDPISPKRKTTFIGFLFLGLGIPFGIIFLKNLLDNKIHSRKEIEKILNIPIIGDIPKLESKDKKLIKNNDYSPVAEAFRILRTNLNFLFTNSKNSSGKTVFITSSVAHEGKSFVATNLATTLAHSGKKTLIIGMDIRAPKIKSYLNLRGKIGVTNYIINEEIKVEDLIISVPEVDNLHLISSGDIAPNPAELLMSERVGKLFDTLKNNYDYIIVDTAAFSMVTDTLIISQFADAFIYVIRANYLDKRMLSYIRDLYKEKRIPNMKLLVNGVDLKNLTYGYGYGYGVDELKKSKIFKKKIL